MARKVAPFLAQIPTRYKQDKEESAFWDYLINYLGGVQDIAEGSQTELSSQLNDIYGDNPNLTITDNVPGDDFVIVNGTQYRSVIVNGGSKTAVVNDFITATNGARITLESNPKEFGVIKVANADGSAILIIGRISTTGGTASDTQIGTTVQGAVYDFQYNSRTNAWMIV